MFARVAMFEQIDVENSETVMRWFDEHRDALTKSFSGFQGGMTLMDRNGARIVEITLYDDDSDAREADAIMNEGPPSEMPQEIRAILMRGIRPHAGVYEVAWAGGHLSGAAS